MSDQRKPWDEYWLDIAALVATRATCPKRAVGVAIVRDRRIVSTGYNGAPAGQPHCLDAGCDLDRDAAGRAHCVRAIHGEDNAISFADPARLPGATVYISGGVPCHACARRLANVGIARLVTRGGNGSAEADFPRKAGVVLAAAGVEIARLS